MHIGVALHHEFVELRFEQLLVVDFVHSALLPASFFVLVGHLLGLIAEGRWQVSQLSHKNRLNKQLLFVLVKLNPTFDEQKRIQSQVDPFQAVVVLSFFQSFNQLASGDYFVDHAVGGRHAFADEAEQFDKMWEFVILLNPDHLSQLFVRSQGVEQCTFYLLKELFRTLLQYVVNAFE